MKLTFHGAAGEVTGSCYLLETGRARVLIDFGMFQGGRESQRRNPVVPAIEPGRLDAVVLTHAHIDHCGRLPMLPGLGLRCPIYCTPATRDLAEIMLNDSAKLQEEEAERANRRRARRGLEEVVPLYESRDVGPTLKLMSAVGYDARIDIAPGVKLRFVDAGHVLGSASAELTVTQAGVERTVCFSGDVGPRGVPLLRDPVPFQRADVLVLESTYGDRDHRPMDQTLAELSSILDEADRHHGKVLVPAFAVGRTQNLIYVIGQMKRDGRFGETPVYIDSPMAVAATELYRRHRELFDEESWRIISDGHSPLNFDTLRFSRTGRESAELNRLDCCAVIIAASGMCTGGRILHHLKHSLWKPQTHVLIVGYQGEGTLGRQLVDGARWVRIMGERILVRAKVHTLGGLSAHAGQTGLVEWASPLRAGRPKVFLTHGEDKPRSALAARLKADLDFDADLPILGQKVAL